MNHFLVNPWALFVVHYTIFTLFAIFDIIYKAFFFFVPLARCVSCFVKIVTMAVLIFNCRKWFHALMAETLWAGLWPLLLLGRVFSTEAATQILVSSIFIFFKIFVFCIFNLRKLEISSGSLLYMISFFQFLHSNIFLAYV